MEQQEKGERECIWDGNKLLLYKMARDILTDRMSFEQVSQVDIWGRKIISGRKNIYQNKRAALFFSGIV